MLHLVNPLVWGSKRAVYCFPKTEISYLIEIYENKRRKRKPNKFYATKNTTHKVFIHYCPYGVCYGIRNDSFCGGVLFFKAQHINFLTTQQFTPF